MASARAAEKEGQVAAAALPPLPSPKPKSGCGAHTPHVSAPKTWLRLYINQNSYRGLFKKESHGLKLVGCISFSGNLFFSPEVYCN